MFFLCLSKATMFLLMVTFMLLQTANSQLDFVRTRCMNTSGNYTNDSAYKKSLDLILTELTNTSSSSMYATTETENPDKVYGLYYCRGDLDTKVCNNCIETASKKVVSNCTVEKDAIIWYQQCTLRYYANNSNTFLENDREFVGELSGDIVANQNQFLVTVSAEMIPLINKTAYGSPSPGYATGEVNITRLQTLYCLVQCSPYITAKHCDQCLKEALGTSASKFSNRSGVLLLNPSCQLRYDFLPFYKLSSTEPSAQSPGSPPASSPLYKNPPPTGKSATYYVIRVAVPLAAVGVLIAGVCFCQRKRLLTLINSCYNQEEGEYNIKEGLSDAAKFSFKAMKKATRNFSEENKLGQGGFGAVYKGMLENEEEVAIKRLSAKSEQGNKEFSNEVVFVAKLQHRNLVRLLGYCVEKKERLLVYEYVPNLSLDHLLFDPSKSKKLDWGTRYKIILGIARGLQYLHHESRFNIVHRDLKTSNILLDVDMNPKIADFGLAKLIVLDHTHGDTTRVAGTMGYMAPEYIFLGQFSTKSDVYSFGVILLEIVSGRVVYKPSQSENDEGLLQLAWRLWKEQKLEELLDPSIKESAAEAIRCIQIGLLCVQHDAVSRPPMQTVLLYLNSDSVNIPLPVSSAVPAFYTSSTTTSITNSTTQTSGIDLYPH